MAREFRLAAGHRAGDSVDVLHILMVLRGVDVRLDRAANHLDEAVDVVIHGWHVARGAHRHDEVDLVEPVGKLCEATDILGHRGASLPRFEVPGELTV